MTMDRRSFLTALGVTGLAVVSTPSRLTGAILRADQSRTFGVQLYTLRSEMAKDVAGTLRRVADIGYREVEFAGYHGLPARDVGIAVRRAGLAAPSVHISLESAEDHWDNLRRAADEIRHRYVVVPWIPEARRRNSDDWRRLAATFNRLGRQAQQAGITFAYHNQAYEFEPIGFDPPLDILLQETDPELVAMQLDVYWMALAGADPFDYLARYPGRFTMLHLKDSSGPPDNQMLDVGSGVIDWARLLTEGERAGVRHVFVEHDEPADPFASVEASFDYLNRLPAPASDAG
jgi:sugar phosphate isomerase/epimerase